MKRIKSGFAVSPSLLILIVVFFITGCQGTQSENATVRPPATLDQSQTVLTAKPTVPAATAIVATPQAQAGKLTLQTAVPTQTPIPTITPTVTPMPPIRVAVPDQWRERAGLAVEYLNQEPGSRTWRLVSPGTTVDLELINEKGHLFIEQQPLALAVPFTTEWENTTIEKAQLIISQGHDLVTLMPWAEIPPTHKALRIDGRFPTDVDYPLQESWSLQTTPGYKQAAAELKAALQIDEGAVVHLVAVGDIMLDRSLGFALEQGNIEYPFSAVSSVLQEADLTIGNLESALGNSGEPAAKRYQFRAPPEAANALASAGFDILSLANNHALDFGSQGLLQGIDLLHEQDIKTAGAGVNSEAAHKPVFEEINGLKLAFLSYVHVPVEATTGFDTASWTATQNSPGLAWADPAQISADVQAAGTESDLVVVLLHSGHEYVLAPSEPQVAAAQAAVDAGADLVIGHHSHVLQGVEFYNDGVIIYGTGNFAFEIDGDPEAALFHIWMDRHGVRQIEIQPAIIQFGGRPRLADESESAEILGQVYYLTKLLNAD